MFEDLLEAAGSPSETPAAIAERLPESFSLKDIAAEIIEPTIDGGNIKHLRAVFACLGSDGLAREGLGESEGGIVGEIARWTGRSIIPLARTASADNFGEDVNYDEVTEWWEKTSVKGELGLRILTALCQEFEATLDAETLLAATAYTNAEADPWTTATASALAAALLDEQLLESSGSDDGQQQQRQDRRTSFITSTILTDFLRPLFSAARPAAVTASGRKAEFVTPSAAVGPLHEAPESERKPWKHARRYAITVFEWAVLHSGPPHVQPNRSSSTPGPDSSSNDNSNSNPQPAAELLSQHWHQYTPVLLALLDDGSTPIKARGLAVLAAFWARCPPGLLDRVGLADVLEHAAFPALLYLPSLTPEPESRRLLDAAYPALLQIAGLPAYPSEAAIGEPVRAPALTEAQRRRLDKIVREGILVGYHHAGGYIHLTELFCNKARAVVNGMGILAVKHLKDLIPMVSAITTDPFSTKYPPALLAAIELLQAIMRCCWPRISTYSTEIINILTMCYLNIEDEDAYPAGAPSKEELRSQLVRAVEVLSAIMRSENCSLAQTAAILVEKEPLLQKLFVIPPPTHSPSGGAAIA